MRTARIVTAALVSTLLAIGCTVYADPIQGGETGAGGVILGPFAVSPTEGGTQVASEIITCPNERPLDDAPCVSFGMVCEYGTTPDLLCNAEVECDGPGAGAWTTRPKPASCIPHTCPSSYSDVTQGASCTIDTDGGAPSTADEYLCGYPEGVCGCATGVDGAHAHARRWDCAPAPLSPCPETRPGLGQACPHENLVCDYGSCLFKHGTAVVCTSGQWIATSVSCN